MRKIEITKGKANRKDAAVRTSVSYQGGSTNNIEVIGESERLPLTNDNVLSSLRTIKEITDRAIKVLTTKEGASDTNVLSALLVISLIADCLSDSKSYTDGEFKKLDKKYVSKLNDDTIQGLITFTKGLKGGNWSINDTISKFAKLLAESITTNELSSNTIKSKGFKSNSEGFVLKTDENGKSYLEVDNALIRRKATFVELVTALLRHVGGQVILSPASMRCIKVEERDNAYRCYFRNTDGEKCIYNEFVVGDLARAQKFGSAKVGVNKNISTHYFWRAVVGVGDDYIDLSKTDCDKGSDAPQVGDDICQFGNKTDTDRQSVILLSAYGEYAGIYQFGGVNDYSLKGKEQTAISPSGNRFTGDFIVRGKNVTEIIDKSKTDAINQSNGYVNGVKNELNGKIGDVKGKIDGLKVGGRNLIRNSGKIRGGDSEYQRVDVASIIKAHIGEELTLSADVSVSKDHPVKVYFLGGYYVKGTETTIQCKAGEWKRVSVTGVCKFVEGDPNGTLGDWSFYADYGSGANISLKNVKVELGNTPTAWTPAPEDLELEITTLDHKVEATKESMTIQYNKTTERLGGLDKRLSQAELKITPDAITSVVKSNIKVGGRNLLKGTSNGWIEDTFYENTAYHTYGFDFVLEKDKWYVFSVEVEKLSSDNNSVSYSVGGGEKAGNYDVDFLKNWVEPIKKFGRQILYFSPNAVDGRWGDGKRKYFAFRFLNGWKPMRLRYRCVKLEEGNIPTDWSAAPEDTESSITELSTRIEQTDKSISLRVNQGKEEVKQEVLSTFNMDAEGISLLGKKLEFNGDAIFNSIDKKLGKTLIKGGLINTSLINVQELAANEAFINNLTAKRLLVKDERNNILAEFDANTKAAKIGGFKVVAGGDGLQSSFEDDELMGGRVGLIQSLNLSKYGIHFSKGRDKRLLVQSGLGANASGVSSGINAAAYAIINDTGSNVAYYADVRGGFENHALYAKNGNICGLRYETRVVTRDYTLTSMDTFILVDGNEIHLYLPDTAEDGQLYIIRNNRDRHYTLHGKIKRSANSYETSDYVTRVYELRYVYVKAKDYWLVSGLQV